MTEIEKYHQEFIDQAIYRINENTPRIQKCLNFLMEDQLWIKENPKSNSIANLILHICGNMRQYIMAGVEGQNDVRKRKNEFEKTEGMSSMQLMKLVTTTTDEAIAVIKSCKAESMLQKKKVQVYELSNIGIITHVVEHYSYHTGQIASMTKAMLNKDLGFYHDVNL